MSLTLIERKIIAALADGLQSKEIAARIGRSRATVEFHVRSLYVKLDARSRAHVVARAFELNVLVPNDVAMWSLNTASTFDTARAEVS